MSMQHIPRSHAVTKAEFHALVRAWLRDTADATVGPPDVDPGAPWVHVRVGLRAFALAAGAPRAAAARYMGLVGRHGDGLEWAVFMPERRGPVVIAYGPDGERVDDFVIDLV